MHHLVGTQEVAEMLGVTPQRIHQLLKTPGFPVPVVKLAAGYIWTRDSVEEWVAAHRSELDEP